MDRIVSRTPSDGFVFPAFSERAADVNCVEYFTANSKKQNISIINNFLQCEFVFTAQGEKETFQKVLTDIAGEELDYTVITHVNEKIEEFIAENKNEVELPTIDDIRLRAILQDVGVSEERLETVKDIYKETVGEKPLTASNLLENKTVVATPDVTINISKDATQKIRTSVVQGRRCLVIDLDDPNIVVNGLPVTVE